MKETTAETLPRNWITARLGEVLEFNYGRGLPSASRIRGPFAVYGSNGVVGEHSSALTPGSTIIVGRKGSAGEVHFCKFPCWPIDTTYFISDFRGCDPLYLFYLLGTLRLKKLDTSTAVPGLNRDRAYECLMPLAPLAEQRRIVAKIEELFSDLDAGVAALERVKANLKRYRAAVLKAAVEGKLTAEWRKKNPATETGEQLLTRILAERRKKWEEGQLKKFAEKGKVPPSGWKGKYLEPESPEVAGLAVEASMAAVAMVVGAAWTISLRTAVVMAVKFCVAA